MVKHLTVSEGKQVAAQYPYPKEGPYCHATVKGTKPFRFAFTCSREAHAADTPHVAYVPGDVVIATW